MDDKGTIWDRIPENREFTCETNTFEREYDNAYGMSRIKARLWVMGIMAIICAVAVGAFGYMTVYGTGIVTIVDVNEYVIFTRISGKIIVIDGPGHYITGFNKIWHYPRHYDTGFDSRHVEVMFNDARVKGISFYAKLQMPVTEENRIALHIKMGTNIENMKKLSKFVANNVLKISAQIMSSKEVITYRKSEYLTMVYDQINGGLYTYKRETSLDGNEIIVVARDSIGDVIRMEPSVLSQYGIKLVQFSIIEIRPPASKAKALQEARAAKQENGSKLSIEDIMKMSRIEKEIKEICLYDYWQLDF